MVGHKVVGGMRTIPSLLGQKMMAERWPPVRSATCGPWGPLSLSRWRRGTSGKGAVLQNKGAGRAQGPPPLLVLGAIETVVEFNPRPVG